MVVVRSLEDEGCRMREKGREGKSLEDGVSFFGESPFVLYHFFWLHS